MLLISSYMLRGQRWRLVALVALFFVAGCTVELYPPAQDVSNLPDGGKVNVLPDTIPRAFAFGPRIYWSQIVASDSAYSIAVTDANNKGRWLDSLRWVPSGPFVTVNGDTLSTRAYARDNSGVTGDNQILTYNGSGSLTIEDGNTVDMSDLLDNTDAQTIDTLTLQGDTMLQVSLSGDGAPVKELDLSALRSVVDSTRLTQDSILVYYQDGAEVGRDTIAGTGGSETITLSGDVTGSGTTAITTTIATGAVGADELASTAVTPGSYTSADITIDADGRITSAASGGGADNLGNHIMTQNLQTNNNWISADGDNEGLYVNGSGNVGIGTNTPSEKLHVSEKIRINNGTINMPSNDVYIGLSTGLSQATTNYNTFIGYLAGKTANSFYNTFLGASAGEFNASNRSTFLGAFAGQQSSAGESVFIGSTAGRYSSAGSSVLIGSEAGDNSSGSNAVIVGFRAGRVNAGGQNIFIGTRAGQNNTNGFNNVLIGYQAGPALTTGPNNTLIGSGNGTLLSTGSANTIIGSSNGAKITTHNFNTIIGTLSGFNFKGSSNLILGYSALLNDTLSNSSVVIGNGAAQKSYNTTSSIFLGNSVGPSSNTSVSSKLYIGNSSGSPTIYGDLATKNIGIGQETADYVLDMGSRTGAIRLPIGTTAQNPTGANGLLRYNSDSTAFTGYYNAQWNRLVDHDYLSSTAGQSASNYWVKSGNLLKWASGGLELGTTSIAATATPLNVSFGGTFGTNTPGSAGNLKWDLFDGGSDIYRYGIGMSINLMEFRAGINAGFGFFPNASTNIALKINKDRQIGIQTNTPTAALHLPAGTATANTAPLKFTSGTNLTTPEAGAMEWDGTNLYITQATGPTRKTIAYVDTDDGSASDTTDGSGDITVSHTLGSASITVTATATGTTFYHVQVHSKTSTTFKIRFFDAAGSPVTSTAVTADWIAKLQ